MIRRIKPASRVTPALGMALLLGLALSSNALADRFRIKVNRIGPESGSGDVIIQIKPGKNEDEFSGKARVMLLGSDPGTNRAMATLLTAVTLGAEVIIDVTNPPSYDDIQVINSMSLVAP
jgi:hypothetical protein